MFGWSTCCRFLSSSRAKAYLVLERLASLILLIFFTATSIPVSLLRAEKISSYPLVVFAEMLCSISYLSSNFPNSAVLIDLN